MRHLIDVDHLELLKSGAEGLDETTAAMRLVERGPNDIVAEPTSSWRALLGDTAKDPMIWFLIVASGLFALIGDTLEAVILGLALVPIIGMDFFLHRRTRLSRESLADRLAESADVLRQGKVMTIPAAALVPGDVAVVDPVLGFPADGVLIMAEDLQVDESMLSGESLPLRKQAMEESVPGESVPHDQWAVAGTRILSGRGRLLVVNTGEETLYGQIVRLAQKTAHEPTPLQQAVGRLVRSLLVAALLLCLALGMTRFWQGHGLVDALISAVVLAVAALPEEFPVVLTFFLGVGVFRLARRKALVRRAVVVERIGQLTCICTDKTGTVTEGRFSLEHLEPALEDGSETLHQAAAMASRTESGDPMDLAIFESNPAIVADRLATFAFTEERRFEAGIWRLDDDSVLAAIKGASETILGLCLVPEEQAREWTGRADVLAASGHKVIACARKPLSDWDGSEPQSGYEFLGLLAFADPLRDGVAQAVRLAQNAGIRIIMMTGDHPGAAQAIAEQAGINKTGGQVILGDELAALLASEDTSLLDDVSVVARCLPAQKLALVQTFRRRGETVGVTGDGVNDVPALKAADVGIAMGERGTRPAREAAAIVLQDDNFATIISAIAEGRQLFTNLRRSFAYLLLVHIPLVLTAALIPFAGYPLVYLPVHIVWLELIIHPTALLAFQALPDDQVMDQPPARKGARLFGPRHWRLILGAGTALSILIMTAYFLGLSAGDDGLHGRSMALTMLIMASAGFTAGLSQLKTRASRWVVSVVVLSTGLILWPLSAALLQLEALRWTEMAPSIAVGLACAIAARKLG